MQAGLRGEKRGWCFSKALDLSKEWGEGAERQDREPEAGPRRWVPGTEVGGGKEGEVVNLVRSRLAGIRDAWGDSRAESRKRKSRPRAGAGAGQRVEGSRASLTESS